MVEERVFPEELREILDLLIRDGLGQEGEGAAPVEEMERTLVSAGIGSGIFGEHFPRLSPEMKAAIAVRLLYQAGLSRLGLDLNPPNMRRDENGIYFIVPTKQHLEQLLKIWTILEKLEEK